MAARTEGGFRQAQAWLHTWCGLWFSWLLFAVFLTGTLAVFDEPITHWMTPEHHAEEAAAQSASASASANAPTADRAQRLAWGMAYMAEHHPTARMWELWPSDAKGGGEFKVYWFNADNQYASAELDPADGRPVAQKPGQAARATLGGHHFVDFHYELHAGTVGLWIVGIAAMAMLVALVSGVITHKRIFKDFFTFRPKKGQRSWLDAHNAVAVLTLPFQFMIAYTGLVISGTTFMPAGKLLHYGAGNAAQARFASELGDGSKPERTGRAMPVPALEAFAARGQQLMGQPVRAVVIDHPGDAGARIGVYGWNGEDESLRRLSATTGMAMFSAATGEVQRVRLPGEADGGTVLLAQSAMGGLHMVSFGGWGMKWLYFLCGLAGTAMMGSGAVLFMVKRRHRHLGEFGGATARVYRLVEALNVAAIAGLALACVGYLWANRLLPVGLAHRADRELQVFFALWAVALLHAFVRQPARAWREQLAALAALCLLLPVLNLLTTGDHLLAQWLRGDWESAGVEMGAVAFGLAAAGGWRHLRKAAT
ncbi:PepSY-associated TM helix domain-containing protein [Variovorax sp. J22G73]|uniref:PepSY-associated TM helix domain-containing protein n=1 Tax=unclassified Variovorax TaxID=663243 RepID=UPI000D5F0FFB|nr:MULTISPECIES: PepSY-associated TM helix domain-containing protein [unclassified Variovorax]MDM0007269.1 PepSY-associated TM helix domain-containing protein [Variovorax sp. J22R203]MDM0098979.1 PepSY-associated TM helix domain-containing protein [Variovorax sp. J22G73]